MIWQNYLGQQQNGLKLLIQQSNCSCYSFNIWSNIVSASSKEAKKAEEKAGEAVKKLENAAAYTDIDAILKDVLKMAMGNPNFHNLEEIPQMLADDDKQYNIYAEICMNFV